jgi:fructose-1,6-bisphosphatase/inositol monophosphatase family enzyme
VLEGAGGSLTDWSGQKLRPDSDGRVIAVGDGALLAPALALLAASAQI